MHHIKMHDDRLNPFTFCGAGFSREKFGYDFSSIDTCQLTGFQFRAYEDGRILAGNEVCDECYNAWITRIEESLINLKQTKQKLESARNV